MSKFEKISQKQFLKDWDDCGYNFGDDRYNEIKLPKRATKGSAGYDFYSPISFHLEPGDSIKIPTGIKVKLDPNLFLMIVPRSSLGFKYRMMLNNTAGIIDFDYYNNENNEGHIFIKIANMGKQSISVNAGEAIAQGIIMPYYLVEDDNTTEVRTGGIGSTSKV